MIRYIDSNEALRVVAQADTDRWIWPTYRRWFTLMILGTVLLMWVVG